MILTTLLAALASPPLAAFQDGPAASQRPWTLLVYGGADNNADGPILEFLHGVRKALDDDPGMELVLFIDRHAEFSDDAELLGEDFTGARIYRLRKDSAERLAGGELFPEVDGDGAEVDSSDARTLQRFIVWGKQHFPARRTGLLIYSHADGRTMCPDEERGGDMGIPELTEVLDEEDSLDFLALELCNMGGIEIAYEWRPAFGRFGADVLLAIPNAGPPLDWHRAFARIRSGGHASPSTDPVLDPAAMTAADFGRLVVEEGRRGRELASAEEPERAAHEAAACYDLTKVEGVKRAVDALAVALAGGAAKQAFVELRAEGMHYDGEEGPYVDLYELCRLAAAEERLGEAVRARAGEAMSALDAFVLASFGMSAYAGFEEGKHGVFVVFPPDAERSWKSLGWYTPLDHLRRNKQFGRWAFLADGATPANGSVENWFELLDSWFDVADAKGGANAYRY
jgi:clostripain